MWSWVASQFEKALRTASDSPSQADAIFCFAGKQSRKLFALQLYGRGLAPRLILSCGRFELRRYGDLPRVPALDLVALAAPVAPELRHFFVEICNGRTGAELVPKGKFGTASEVAALSDWLSEHSQVKRVLLVSSKNHLRRIRGCWNRYVQSGVAVQFVAESGAQPENARELAVELGKCLLYSAYFRFAAGKGGAPDRLKRQLVR